MRPVATSLPSIERLTAAGDPGFGLSGVNATAIVCLPGASLIFGDDVGALEAEEVVVEANLSLPQEQGPAGGVAAQREDHAFRAVLRNLDRRRQRERHAHQLRAAAFRQPGHARVERDLLAPVEVTRTQGDIHAFGEAVVERQDVVLGRVRHEEILQLAQLLWVLGWRDRRPGCNRPPGCRAPTCRRRTRRCRTFPTAGGHGGRRPSSHRCTSPGCRTFRSTAACACSGRWRSRRRTYTRGSCLRWDAGCSR